MNMHRLNFNLIKVFHAILMEGSVSKAAQKLYLSQSACSMALNQLRKLLKDPLFSREGTKMVPTAYALEIAPELQTTLATLERVFNKENRFDPAQSQREFRIGTSEYTQMIFLPKLLSLIKKESLSIKLTAVHFRMCSLADPSANKLIDVGLGILKELPSACQSEILFEEKPVFIGHPSNPTFSKNNQRNKILQTKHIQWCCDIFNIQSAIAESMQKQHSTSDDSLVKSSDFLSCLLTLKENKEYIATIPEKLALKVYKHFNLALAPAKIKHSKASVAMFWPNHVAHDQGLTWLLTKIRQTANIIKNNI